MTTISTGDLRGTEVPGLPEAPAAAPTETVAAPVGGEASFMRLLANTLVTGVTSSFVWFALTFWVYLETRSVVATAVVGAAFSLSAAVVGPAYGTYVDAHRKHQAMVLSTAVSAVCFSIATVMFLAIDAESLRAKADDGGFRPDRHERPVEDKHILQIQRLRHGIEHPLAFGIVEREPVTHDLDCPGAAVLCQGLS